MVAEGFMGFLDVVREGHPFTPIVVVSPFIRPDAEDEPNRLGATLADIRDAIESVARGRIASGDQTLTLVAGKSVIGAEHLGDAIHPDDEGHKRIASAMSKALKAAMAAAEQLPAPAEVDDKDAWGVGDRDEFDSTLDSTSDSDGDDGGGGDYVEDADNDATVDDLDDSGVAATSSAG
jgi:hypothetical protein